MLNVNVECQISACLVRMIWVKDQHAQAQQWIMHAQARAQAQLQRKRRPAVSCQIRSMSFRIKSDPCQAAPVSCRVKSAPCPCLAGRVVSDRGVSSCPCHVGATLQVHTLGRQDQPGSSLSQALLTQGFGLGRLDQTRLLSLTLQKC